MRLEQLEAYLDGELPPQEREAVDRAVAADADVARRLAALKSERALRKAAFATYMPDEATARAEVQALLAKCAESETPAVAGRIGWTWTKRIAAAAAVIALSAGSFYMGRSTSPQIASDPVKPPETIVPEKVEQPVTQYVVVVMRGSDVVDQVVVASMAEAKEVAARLSAEHQAMGSDDVILAGVL